MVMEDDELAVLKRYQRVQIRVQKKLDDLHLKEVEAAPVTRETDLRVWVQRQWNSWRGTAIPLSKIEGLHWSDVSGGVMKRAPRSFLHGYVWCDQVIGKLDHSCEHGPPPHRIKVCIVKNANKEAWSEILLAVAANAEKA